MCAAMYEHVVVEHCTAVMQCRKHNAAQPQSNCVPIRVRQRKKQAESIYCAAVPQTQHSTAQLARTKLRSKYVPISARQRKQADRVGENQHMSSRIFFKNVSCEYDRWVVETQLCKLRDTSDKLIGRACAVFQLKYFEAWCL